MDAVAFPPPPQLLDALSYIHNCPVSEKIDRRHLDSQGLPATNPSFLKSPPSRTLNFGSTVELHEAGGSVSGMFRWLTSTMVLDFALHLMHAWFQVEEQDMAMKGFSLLQKVKSLMLLTAYRQMPKNRCFYSLYGPFKT